MPGQFSDLEAQVVDSSLRLDALVLLFVSDGLDGGHRRFLTELRIHDAVLDVIFGEALLHGGVDVAEVLLQKIALIGETLVNRVSLIGK